MTIVYNFFSIILMKSSTSDKLFTFDTFHVEKHDVSFTKKDRSGRITVRDGIDIIHICAVRGRPFRGRLEMSGHTGGDGQRTKYYG